MVVQFGRARVTEGEVAVGRAGERFDDNGRLNEPNLDQEVHEVITTLLADAQSRKTSPPDAGPVRSVRCAAATRHRWVARPNRIRARRTRARRRLGDDERRRQLSGGQPLRSDLRRTTAPRGGRVRPPDRVPRSDRAHAVRRSAGCSPMSYLASTGTPPRRSATRCSTCCDRSRGSEMWCSGPITRTPATLSRSVACASSRTPLSLTTASARRAGWVGRLFTADTPFLVYMDPRSSEPSMELHSRAELVPVFDDLNLSGTPRVRRGRRTQDHELLGCDCHYGPR